MNYCLYKIGNSELVCVGGRHYKAGVIVLMFFNDVYSHIICKKFRLHSSFVWSLGTKIFIRRYGRHSPIDYSEQEFEALVSPSAL